MSARIDASDPAIQQALNDIKSLNGSTRWFCLDYVPKSDNKLRLTATGSDGLSEMLEYVNDGKILYFLIWFNINNTRKFAYISWCGEGVTGMKKGLFNNHAQDVALFLKSFHAQINARTEKDLKEQSIIDRLTKATGAAYDSGAKNQGSTKLVPNSVAQGREQSNKSNAKVRVFEKTQGTDQSTENSPMSSSIKYDQAKLDQTTESRPAPSAIKYEQARLDQSTESSPNQSTLPGTRNPSSSPAVKGSASSIKSRFEQPQQSNPPSGPPKPAPGRMGPKPPSQPSQPPQPPVVTPKFIPEPEPEPEPEPIQEQTPEEPPFEPEPEPEPEPIPETYEEPIPETSYESEPAQQESYEGEGQSYDGGNNQSTNNGMSAKALYDYDAENSDDLSFKEGDLINVLDQSDPSGWWEGEFNGKVGFFPSNFVQLQ